MTDRRAPKVLLNGDEARLLFRRLQWTNLGAWASISIVLTLYVLNTYPSDSHMAIVFARQAANWMPFAFMLPVLCIVATRFPAAAPRGMQILLWILIGVAMVFGYLFVRFLILQAITTLWGLDPQPWTSGINHLWPIAGIVYSVLLILFFGLIARISKDRAEEQTRRLEADLTKAQLRSLQSQIRPHFLFNTLQAIEDACWNDDPGKKVSRMILQLSDLLRASLVSNDQEVQTLADDLRLATQYMNLQQARFGQRLRYVEEVDADLLKLPFPALFLQPLLENAIMHGIEHLQAGGEVRVSAQRKGSRFHLQIVNDGPSKDVLDSKTEHGTKMGLANTSARLQSLYGPSACFDFRHRSGGGAIIEIDADFKEDA